MGVTCLKIAVYALFFGIWCIAVEGTRVDSRRAQCLDLIDLRGSVLIRRRGERVRTIKDSKGDTTTVTVIFVRIQCS